MRAGVATTRGRVGWVLLIAIMGLMLLNHAIGITFVAASADERQMFVGYAAANALALLVVVFAYRRREAWAWYAVWVFVVAVGAALPLSGGSTGVAYFAAALGLALGQLLVARDMLTPADPTAPSPRSDSDPARDRRIRWRIAGVLSLVLGVGFGIPAAYGAWYLAVNNRLWRFLGEPTVGDGPFVQVGIPNSVPLIVAFVVVCAAGAVCGILLLATKRAGAVLAIALLPIELVFWIGFALPFAFPLGVARVVLVVWPSKAPVRAAEVGGEAVPSSGSQNHAGSILPSASATPRSPFT